MGRALHRAQYAVRTLASKENWLCRKLGLVWKVEVQWCVTEIHRKWAFSSVVHPTTLLKGRLKAFSFCSLERAFGELKKWRLSGRLFIGWTVRESIAADWGKIRWKNKCLQNLVNKVFLLTHYLFLSTSLMYRIRTWLGLKSCVILKLKLSDLVFFLLFLAKYEWGLSLVWLQSSVAIQVLNNNSNNNP